MRTASSSILVFAILQPLMVERCNGYFPICGENNVWKLTPKVTVSDMHIRIKKEVFSYLSRLDILDEL